MKLPPAIIDAMRAQCEAMGLGFNPEGLEAFAAQGLERLPLAMAMSSPAVLARELLAKTTAAWLDYQLPNCVGPLGDEATLVSMPLDDVRFAYGYLALVEAGAGLTDYQIKRAVEITGKLAAASTSERGSGSSNRSVPKKKPRRRKAGKKGHQRRAV